MRGINFDADKVTEHLEKHRTLEGCAFCRAAVPRQVRPPVHGGVMEPMLPPYDPPVFVPVVCPRCGYVQLFWGVTLGVVGRVEK